MENFIFGSMGQLDKLKIPYCLTASSLLAFHLQKKPFKNDTEIDFIVPVEYRKTILKNSLKYYFIDKKATSGFGCIVFLRDGDIYRTNLTFIITRGKYAILNILQDRYCFFDKDIIFPFNYIEFEGRKVPVPYKYEKYLQNIYGDKWQERRLDWHATKDQKVIIHASSVDDAIKKYENKNTENEEEKKIQVNTLTYILNKYNLKKNQPQHKLSRSKWGLSVLFKELGFNLGAVIGVETGRFSKCLLSVNSSLKLYAVEVWGEPDDETYYKAKKRLEPFDCQIIRDTSMNAVKMFADKSLDFVYINAIDDIEEWSKKVRKGGILAGNDYQNGLHGQTPGVKRAVNKSSTLKDNDTNPPSQTLGLKKVLDKWVKKNKIRPLFIFEKNIPSTWFYIKGRND